MKVHVLAATVVAALASRAVLALSEGGDTWSAIQVVGQQDERLPQFMPRVHPPVTRQIVWEGSEDGDPCPELGVLQEQAAAASVFDQPAANHATIDHDCGRIPVSISKAGNAAMFPPPVM